MSLTESFTFDKNGEVVPVEGLHSYRPLVKRLFLSLSILLVASLSFGIGRLSVVSEDRGVEMNYKPELLLGNDQGPRPNDQVANSASSLDPRPSNLGLPASGSVYASSKGTKYYYTHCKSTISEKNKVTFATAVMAEKAGYTLAKGCKP